MTYERSEKCGIAFTRPTKSGNMRRSLNDGGNNTPPPSKILRMSAMQNTPPRPTYLNPDLRLDQTASESIETESSTTFAPNDCTSHPVPATTGQNSLPRPAIGTLVTCALCAAAVLSVIALVFVSERLFATQAAYKDEHTAFVETKNTLDRTAADYATTKEILSQEKAKLDEIKKSGLLDSLDTGWFDTTKWKTARRKTSAVDGYVRLINRGSLATVAEFRAPMEIEFDWRWIDLAGQFYADSLTVAVHTSGEHAPEHRLRYSMEFR